MTDLPRDIEHELAALADDSLARERREQAHARVSESRELRSALAEQRRAVELLGAVDARAPASLHRQVEAMLIPARPGRQRANARCGFAGVRVGVAAAGAAAPAAAAVRR